MKKLFSSKMLQIIIASENIPTIFLTNLQLVSKIEPQKIHLSLTKFKVQ